jgi:hypothetical protein
VICPNARIRRSVDSLSTSDLKAHALDLLRSHNTRMSSPALNQNHALEPTVFKCPESSRFRLDACLLPGLPYVVWVSTEGSVHLLHTSEGEVEKWKDPSHATEAWSAEIELFESSQHGTMIFMGISVRRSGCVPELR